MGLRFRRRVKIAPGVSLNISKSGVGISAGPRGAKIGVGPRGVHRSVGIPGTGLSYREEARWKSGNSMGGSTSSNRTGSNEAVLEVRQDGSVALVGHDGEPVPPRLAKLFREQHADQIQSFLERACDRWNAGIDEILTVHLSTPDPAVNLEYEMRSFAEKRPDPFVPRRLGVFGRFWRPWRERTEQANEAGRKAQAVAVAEWEERKDRFEAEERAKEQDYVSLRYSDLPAMERVLEDRLSAINWPRTTEVSYQLREQGQELWVDVDLPEVEDMPRERATTAARGLKLNITTKSETQVRREYMRHVHAILFRLVGEAFFSLPTVRIVVASGYSQRPDPATGHVRDDYLISARVARSKWAEADFANLDALDVVACFERFDLTRKMTKTGIFTPVNPHVEGEA
jgi:hypothetical protein